jgi:excisionase family DNA binding protein
MFEPTTVEEKQSDSLSSTMLFDKLKWMTSKEAAAYIRVSVGQLRNMVWRGQIKRYRLRNRLRFLRSDLDSFVTSSNKGD